MGHRLAGGNLTSWVGSGWTDRKRQDFLGKESGGDKGLQVGKAQELLGQGDQLEKNFTLKK